MMLPLLLLSLGLGQAEGSGFVETRVVVRTVGVWFGVRDLDGDGAQELVHVDENGVAISFLGADARYSTTPADVLEWTAADVAWDFADIDGDGASELVAIEDAERVRVWEVTREGGFDEGRELLAVEGRLPRGRHRVEFARDVNDDGRLDVVVPDSGRYRIHVALDEGWAPPLTVTFEPRVNYELGDPDRLDGSFGVAVRIPWFRLDDFDGDGRTDLVSETEDVVHFHLADPDLPADPTWSLDKRALEARQESPDIDFDDLFASLGDIVDWRVEDLDGQGARDLVVQQGSTIRIYLEGARTGIRKTPDAQLRSSGQVLGVLFDDRTGDGLPELLVFRAEKLSLGRVVRWLVLPGSLDFDVFAYENQGGSFPRRPMSRYTISLAIPRILGFLDELEERAEEVEKSLSLPIQRGSFGGDGRRDDIVDVVGELVVVYPDCAPEEEAFDVRKLDDLDIVTLMEDFVLEQLDGLSDGDVAEVDLGELKDIDLSPADELLRAREGVEAIARHPLADPPGDGPDAEGVVVRTADLDGDGRSDLVVHLGFGEAEYRTIQFLVWRGR